MVRWDAKEWQDHRNWLTLHPEYPMVEEGAASVYLSNFYTIIALKIETEASEIAEKGRT